MFAEDERCDRENNRAHLKEKSTQRKSNPESGGKLYVPMI